MFIKGFWFRVFLGFKACFLGFRVWGLGSRDFASSMQGFDLLIRALFKGVVPKTAFCGLCRFEESLSSGLCVGCLQGYPQGV